MFTLDVPDEILEKLRTILEDEDEGVCVRLREYNIGGGWHSKVVLGLGTDEPDEDEDERIDVKDVPFIVEKDFLLKYGRAFKLTINENEQIVLIALTGA